jgi:plastocyanin
MRGFRPLLWVLTPVFALLAAGCNDSVTAPPPSPQSWTVQAGASIQQEALQALAFLPAAITVNEGDTVTWNFPSGEPHTVALVPPGGTLPPPDDPNAPKPAGGSTYDGTVYTSSGFVLLGGKYSLQFPKAGTYTVHCIIHPGMVQTVTVNHKGTAYPSNQAAYNTVGAATQTSILTAAADSVATFSYPANGNHLAVGISPQTPGGSPATVLRYLNAPVLSDQPITIAVGTTLTFTNLSNNEPHTVSLGIVGQPFPTIQAPGAPTGNTTYDGSAFSNSGIIAPGQSYSLTFTKAGSYVIHCVYHDDTENMIRSLIVQ